MKSPLVSIIFFTKNNESFIENALKAARNQSYKNIEIIVVDNNSKDRTKLISSKYADRVYNHGPERTYQINFGVDRARGKYVYFTGGDLEMDKNLVEQAVNKLEKFNCDAIYLNVLTALPHPNLWQRARALERRLYYKQPGMSAARFCKKSVFMKVGGLDESLGGISDDLEFQHRLNLGGYKTEFIDAKENNFGEYSSLKIIILRSLYYGFLIRKYFKKHPQKTKKQYSLVRQEFKDNKSELFKNKLDFIYFLIYKVLQYFFGGMGFALSFFSSGSPRIQKTLYNLNYNK